MGANMHGLQTMKYLNEKAIAEAMMKKRELIEIDPAFQSVVKEALAARVKNISQ